MNDFNEAIRGVVENVLAELLELFPCPVPPVPVTDLLGYHHLSVKEVDEPAHHHPDPPMQRCGRLNGLLRADRQRIYVKRSHIASAPAARLFTVAHELGHYFLHYRLGRSPGQALFTCQAATSQGTPQHQTQEHEADRFAIELLMPVGPLTTDAAVLRGNVLHLADRYRVTRAAMKRRLAELSLCCIPIAEGEIS